MKKLYREAVDFLAKYWYTPYTPIILYILVIIFTKDIIPEKYTWLIRTAIAIAVFIIWYKNKVIKKACRNKLGCAVAIRTLDEKEENKIKEAFIYELRDQLSNSIINRKFQLVEIQQYYAREITNKEDAVKVLRKSRCQFILHGSAILGIHEGKEYHYLKLKGTVTHAPISKAMHKIFQSEMKAVCNIKERLPVEDDIIYFEIKAEEVNYAARYIIGIAALVSNYLDVARDIFEEIDNALDDRNIVPIIKKRISVKLDIVYYGKAMRHYWKWVENGDMEELKKTDEYSNKVKEKDDPRICLLRSVCLFVIHRNITAARGQILKCRGRTDNTWRFNLAFIDAYEGNMEEAYKNITKACREVTNTDVAYQVELFLDKILLDEPDKYQLYVLLGIINQDLKEDMKLAKKNYKAFLENHKEGEYEHFVEITKSRLGVIEKTELND
jgi:hypothetical protein